MVKELLGITTNDAVPDAWCIQVTSDDATGGIIFRESETGKRHWIEKVSVTNYEKEPFSIYDGDNILIGPITTSEGVTWEYNFHRAIHGTANQPLKLATETTSRIHMLIEGHTDVYLSKASNPNPEDQATDVSVSALMTWDSSPQTVSHTVYMGTNPSPSMVHIGSDNSYTPETLEGGTTYYWRVDESDGDNIAEGDIWTFSTGGD